ncbi:MAG TPA: AIR synthase related protein [Solirubrobacteraceae bacterium]|nr:AIR synthase related protein [Solirubrobacteraceae bacterium]
MADPDSDVHSAYRRAGVDYAVLDASKRSALAEALATSHWLAAADARAVDGSRGEPAFVLRFAGSTLAFVLETLGTKSIVAREYHELAGVNRFDHVAYDTVAAILNDLICVGALPLVVNAYFATGSSAWYERAERADALLAGWRRACDDAQCAWGGGESPSLVDLLAPAEIELAGSALGFVPPPGEPLLGEALAPGDEIVLLASSGLHANGASLARRIAARLPRGLLTELPDGTSFGEALLAPSVLYVELLRRLLAETGMRAEGTCLPASADGQVQLTYLSHITGHGLLKLMRPQRELTYRIRALPPAPPVLAFLAAQAELDAAAAHSTLNMGAGFAVYCRPGGGARVVEVAHELGLGALLAGAVEEGPRQVILEPVGVTFAGDQLALAPERSP